MTTLVIGYGNPLRGDDGAGLEAVRRLEASALNGVTCRTLHQLAPEVIEDALGFDRVLLVDAAVGGPDVRLSRVADDERAATAAPATHGLSPAVLWRLAQVLHGREMDLWVCTLRADGFALGAPISPACAARIEAAVQQIAAFLQAPK